MTRAPDARKPKLHAGCVEIELRVDPPAAAGELVWERASSTPQGAQIVLTEEGPWLRLDSFSVWPVRVTVPTQGGETLELVLGGGQDPPNAGARAPRTAAPTAATPPTTPAASDPQPRIEPPASPPPVKPETARLALMELRSYMRSFSSARAAPEPIQEAIVRRVGAEMAKAWELVRRVPKGPREELHALFDEITAAMPAARQVAQEQA